MTYSTSLETMWLAVFGNTVLASIALLAAFSYLCFRKRYGTYETFLVLLPVVLGAINSGYLPVWVKGLFDVGLGILWGLAILKLVGSRIA